MRKSIVIATPSFGKVSIRWAQNFRALATPMNSLCPCISEVGFPVDVARNRIVKISLGLECKPSHIFWLDDDVLCHPYSMLQLIAAKKDVIGGVYFTKDDHAEPLIFDEQYSSPSPYIPNSGIRKTWACGGGLTLVKTEVYRKMLDTLDLGKDDMGNPRWYYTSGDKPDESYRCNEDMWFADKANESGHEVWIDTSMMAFGWHYDIGAEKGYPTAQWAQYLATGKADWEVPDELVKPKRRRKKAS